MLIGHSRKRSILVSSSERLLGGGARLWVGRRGVITGRGSLRLFPVLLLVVPPRTRHGDPVPDDTQGRHRVPEDEYTHRGRKHVLQVAEHLHGQRPDVLRHLELEQVHHERSRAVGHERGGDGSIPADVHQPLHDERRSLDDERERQECQARERGHVPQQVDGVQRVLPQQQLLHARLGTPGDVGQDDQRDAEPGHLGHASRADHRTAHDGHEREPHLASFAFLQDHHAHGCRERRRRRRERLLQTDVDVLEGRDREEDTQCHDLRQEEHLPPLRPRLNRTPGGPPHRHRKLAPQEGHHHVQEGEEDGQREVLAHQDLVHGDQHHRAHEPSRHG
mmetsp:Transcript_2586/g.11701  ORF Transcript_2586/g.11701 Transcript_2586/m.11701 type:complete len:334 (+) Transcript_2586:1848-2849(+)